MSKSSASQACDVTRCCDEATPYPHPRIRTAQRDVQMGQALEG